MERVSEAMESIMPFLEADSIGEQPFGREVAMAKAGVIEGNYEDLKGDILDGYKVVCDNWNRILESEPYQREVQNDLASYESFRGEIRRFDECFSLNLDSALKVFRDEWIARKYLISSILFQRRVQFIADFSERNFVGRTLIRDRFTGAARKLRGFFVGVSDESLRNLAEGRVPLPGKPKWLGDRRSATIFGRMLGLPCSLMNRSFLFLGRDGMPRDLNYSQDGTDLSFESYDITPIVRSIIEG